MLVNFTDSFSKHNKLDIMYVGTVVKNDHPEKLIKVKVQIPDLFNNIKTEDLPWFPLFFSTGLGSSSYTSTTCIPEVGTEVVVQFPYRDIYHGIVTGILRNKIQRQNDPNDVDKEIAEPAFSESYFSNPVEQTYSIDMEEDYPNSYGWIDSIFNFFKINKIKKTFQARHSSDTKMKVDEDGNTSVHIKGNLKFIVDGDVSWDIKGETDIIHHKNLYTHIKKDEERKIGQNLDTQVGGNETRAVSGYTYSTNASYLIRKANPIHLNP